MSKRPDLGYLTTIGAVPPPSAPGEERFTLADLGGAVRKITPTILILGAVTGAAFAFGSGLVHRYVFKEK